jgi:microcystin-dependent protein
MPYQIQFTDNNNKSDITVFDNTSSTDTSLTFPGRNVTGYGKIIAENFLHLLENFASATQPVNPVEGQLWYDSTNGYLQLWDNTAWKAASNIQKSPTEPDVATSKTGELWVDTTNQQLRIYTGTRWILVGPSESSLDGLRYGPAVEQIDDADNATRSILVFYVADIPVMIISKDSFSPKISIPGFTTIKSGINVNIPADDTAKAQFEGAFLPKYYGTASSADSLIIADVAVAASKFLRSDTVNTTEYGINVRNNTGVNIGIDGTFNLSSTSTSARIYNSASGSSIDLQTNRNSIPTTIVRIIDNQVGINNQSPEQALDVGGNIGLSGQLIVSDTTASTNLNNGSIRTLGGMSITKNLIIGDDLSVTGVINSANVQPRVTDTYDNGTSLKRWKTIRAKTIIADTIEGSLSGNINGTANSAINLKNVTTFNITGDIELTTAPLRFDGQVDGLNKVFTTRLTTNIIQDKTEASTSEFDDYVLVYRDGTGLLKAKRDIFVADLGIPIGTLLPFAGNNVPDGFLLCDGSEVTIIQYPDLYDVIGTTYNGATPTVGIATYRLPDMRGRFALGRDNMDNGLQIPYNAVGGSVTYVDAGGGTASRVPDIKAQILGESAGQNEVNLSVANLPQHSHTLASANQEYAALANTTATDPAAITGPGPTAAGQAQYLKDSGGVKVGAGVTLGTAVGLMNPYLTINYIIRSGPPVF